MAETTTNSLADRIDDVKRRILNIGDLVEVAISRAIAALLEGDRMLAGSVVAADAHIDRKEVEVEQQCIGILLGHHPENGDMRFIIATLKINNDLERVGDLAVNIAKTVVKLVDHEGFRRLAGCKEMAGKAEAMLHRCLKALVDSDVNLARKVIAADDEVDNLHKVLEKQIARELDRNPEHAAHLLKLAHVARQLERVGDMATNIAEDVIYMVEGKIVRHASKMKPTFAGR